MKKIVLLATLSICNMAYSSESAGVLSYKQESQRRRLPSESVIEKALQNGGYHNLAEQKDFIKSIANKELSYLTIENRISGAHYGYPSLKISLTPRGVQETTIIVFKTGTPVEDTPVKNTNIIQFESSPVLYSRLSKNGYRVLADLTELHTILGNKSYSLDHAKTLVRAAIYQRNQFLSEEKIIEGVNAIMCLITKQAKL